MPWPDRIPLADGDGLREIPLVIPALRHLLGSLVPMGLALTLGGAATLRAAPLVTALSKPADGDRATRTVGFTRLDPLATGLVFTNVVTESRYLTNQIYLNGSGVACGDVDGDGVSILHGRHEGALPSQRSGRRDEGCSQIAFT